MNDAVEDKAGKDYWDGAWHDAALSPQIDVTSTRIQDYVRRQYHRLFQQVLGPEGGGRALLEVGAARSVWLPYFARQGYAVSGIDYSPQGVELARRQLDDAGVSGTVVLADFFDPPAELLNAFDVVVSFGVAEHFSDTARCVRAFGSFLRPGGLMLTLIPNMVGAPGWIQKRINREVFDVHVPLGREELHRAHADAGLTVVRCDYLLPVNPGVLNLAGLPAGSLSWRVKRVGLAVAVRAARVVWRQHEKTGRPRATRTFAPYVVCVARRPE